MKPSETTNAQQIWHRRKRTHKRTVGDKQLPISLLSEVFEQAGCSAWVITIVRSRHLTTLKLPGTHFVWPLSFEFFHTSIIGYAQIIGTGKPLQNVKEND